MNLNRCRPVHRHAAALAAATTLLLFATAPARAQPSAADLRAGAYLAGNCANCHGTAGRAAGTMPSLAGVPKDNLLRTLTEFRDGRRPATLMHQLTKGYSDDQLALIAEYLSRQPAK